MGLDMDDPVWDHSSFTKNRERLLNEAVARAFFEKVLGLAGYAVSLKKRKLVGEDRWWSAQGAVYWTGQGEGADRLYLGCLQPVNARRLK